MKRYRVDRWNGRFLVSELLATVGGRQEVLSDGAVTIPKGSRVCAWGAVCSFATEKEALQYVASK